MRVATPPIDAAYAIESIYTDPYRKPVIEGGDWLSRLVVSNTWLITAAPIGVIIRAVAVFEIHIEWNADATILGVQVQEMVDVDTGIETIIGMSRDPQFGPLLMFGLGGIFVEVFEDTTFRVAPITEPEARAMTQELAASSMFSGVRGREAIDMRSVITAIQRLSQLVTDFPAILELDINPLVAQPDGVHAIDIRLTVNPEKL